MGRNTAQFPIAGHIRGAIPGNWPRTKNLKRHLTFWPAPFLKADLKARSRNERRDADNYKTVAMGYPESSSSMNRWPWTAMVAPPADLRHGSARVGHSKRIHLSELSSFHTIEGACSRLLSSYAPHGK